MAQSLPRSRDADRSRSAILDAAESLFALQGYHPTSLAEVGERAGVSRGTPGYFFGSKEQLYRAVLDRCFADALDAVRTGRIRAEKSGGTRGEILAGVVSDYVDYAASRPDFVRLIHREALGEGPDPEPSSTGMAVGGEAVSALAKELAMPSSPAGTAEHLALSLLALTWFTVLHAGTMVRSVGLDAAAPAFLEQRKLHITRLLLGALPAGLNRNSQQRAS